MLLKLFYFLIGSNWLFFAGADSLQIDILLVMQIP